MDTKILMSLSYIKARYRARNSSKLRSATLFAFYTLLHRSTIFKKYFTKQFKARVDIDTPSDD